MVSSDERKVTPLQFALDLFIDRAPLGTSIDKLVADKDIGYQKNRVFSRIIGLGMSARRFVDAAYFIVAQDPEIQEGYDVALGFFKWLMRYDSNHKQHFSSVIRSVKSSMLEVTNAPVVTLDASGRMIDPDIEAADDEAPGGRASERNQAVDDEEGEWLELIGRVSVKNGRIRFRVPVELQRLIKDPDNSYWTSLLITSRFTLIYARAIYDHVLPLVPRSTTEWLPLDLVRNLPGKSWANSAEFKYFKRDYLEPAMSQINELSDIELSYETRAGTAGSRKKDQIRFKFKFKETAGAAKADMLNSVTLFMTLFERAIEYTRWRIREGDKIRRAAAYLMKALSDDYRVSEADRQVATIQSQRVESIKTQHETVSARQREVEASVAATNAAAEMRRQDEIRRAREFFDQADPKTRDDLVRKFVASSAMGQRVIERHLLKPAQVTEANILTWPDLANTFGSFVANELRKAARAHTVK